MPPDSEPAGRSARGRADLIVLALLASLTGACAGLVGALFRLSLDWADEVRNALVGWAHGKYAFGFLCLVVSCSAAALVAAWLVRRFAPEATGSGIPHVEAALARDVPPMSIGFLPVKFLGGVLALGSGLALGREGPSVQMSASIAYLVGKVFRRDWSDCRALIAGGAGAGLATAFNAPIAGAIFVLEELVGRFEPRIAAVALGASATAITVSRSLLGDAPDFHVPAFSYDALETKPLFFLLGAAAGLLAILYNRTLLGALAVADRLRWPVEIRAAAIGGAVGALAWFAPALVGGGDPITQRTLLGAEVAATLPALFLLRLALGSASYAAGTPGGLFAPMLVLGAQTGLFFGLICRHVFPDLGIQPEAFALVGMAAFFTGVVRSPLTGIALVIEMTGGGFTMLLPMLAACFGALLVPGLLGDPPIYESLRRRVKRRSTSDEPR
jgi:chloride channel protein, CIC family